MNKENGDRLTGGEQDDSWGGGRLGGGGIERKEKVLVDMDNSVVIAGEWEV